MGNFLKLKFQVGRQLNDMQHQEFNVVNNGVKSENNKTNRHEVAASLKQYSNGECPI